MRQDPFGRTAAARPAGARRRGFSPRMLILVLFAGYAVFYYFSNRTVDPYTGEKVLIDKSLSAEDEEALGLQAYREILSQERPIDPNSEVAGQIQEIARRLVDKIDEVEGALAAERGLQPQYFAEEFNWEVSVLDSDQVNAFALPGGKMAVYTGLVPVAQNADAMAAVMGHEIAHALLRHGAQRMTEQKLVQIGQMAGAASGMDAGQMQTVMAIYGYGRALPYARKHETEADEVGLMLMAAACFDPRESVPLWERMSQASGGQAPPEFASTHPNPGTRIAHLQELMPKAQQYREQFCRQ
ncbi:M48 family metallopeptidase [Luteimonas vadosa]|uniref:M48 family metallopeptidase n=1 Tax=Luteimonas vadosa TaxID=1165507 RepID=A0ABP9E505_9GAMM